MTKNLYVHYLLIVLFGASISHVANAGIDDNYCNALSDIGNSSATTLDIAPAPLPMMVSAGITLEPRDTTVCEGEALLFAVNDTNSTSYQWQQYNGSSWASLTNGGSFSGVDDDTLRINPASFSLNTYGYRCVVYGSPANDTSITVTLTVNPATANAVEKQICTGDSAFLEGAWHDTAGVFTDTYSMAITGCDSLVTTTLVIADSLLYDSAMSVCSGDSVQIYGTWRRTIGTWLHYETSAFGCDSIIRVSLSLILDVVGGEFVDLCEGDSLFLGSHYRHSAGIYPDTTTSLVTGCDSIANVTVVMFTDTTIAATFELCPGDSVFLGGAWQTATGTYSDTLISAGACHEVLATTVTVAPVPTVTVSPSSILLCEGTPTQITGTYSDSSQWYRNGKKVVAANSSSLTVYTGGHYNLMNINPQGCSDSAAVGCIVTTQWCLGLEEYDTRDISIWPNPTTGDLNITIPGSAGNAAIEVLNITGKTVLSRSAVLKEGNTTVKVSLDRVPDGIYMIVVKTDDYTSTKRIVKG